MSHQRRATSSSDQPATPSGRLRKTTWRWLLITAKPRTSTPNARHAALRGIGSDRTETGQKQHKLFKCSQVSCQSHPFTSSPGSRDLRFSVRIVGGIFARACPSRFTASRGSRRAAIREGRGERPGPSDRNKTRTEKICVRLSPDEFNALKIVAKHRGVSAARTLSAARCQRASGALATHSRNSPRRPGSRASQARRLLP